MSLKQRMNLLEVIVPEIALAHQIHASNMVVGKGKQLITKKDSVRVVMHVEVLYGQIVQFPQTLIS